jgi:transposase
MTHYFRPSPSMPNIYLYRDPVDFRKSYRGLAAIVEQELEHNPFEGGLYYKITSTSLKNSASCSN